MLWRIVGKHRHLGPFVAGLIVEDGRVVQAAPLLGWAKGKPWAEAKVYLKCKGYHGEPLSR